MVEGDGDRRRLSGNWSRGRPPMGEAMWTEGLWVSVRVVKHRIIVRTAAGGARLVSRLIDEASLPGIMGTIAGNDSVAVICTGPEEAVELLDRITDLLGPSEGRTSSPDE